MAPSPPYSIADARYPLRCHGLEEYRAWANRIRQRTANFRTKIV